MNIVKTTTLVCLLTITALGGSYSAKADAGLLGCDPKVLEKTKSSRTPWIRSMQRLQKPLSHSRPL